MTTDNQKKLKRYTPYHILNIFAIMGGLVTIWITINYYSTRNSSINFIVISFAITSCLLISTMTLRDKSNRMNQYVTSIKDKQEISITNLARTAETSEKQVKKELLCLIEKGDLAGYSIKDNTIRPVE